MDNRLKHIMENYDNMRIGLDDTFRFHCTICGKCCINREDILLNPYDIYRIAKALGKELHEVFFEYCETYLGETSRMVLVRLKPRGSIKRCPLLVGQKCSVHAAKPAVCALYPLGRGLKSGIEETGDLLHREVQYIFQKPDCGDASEEHTVRDWLKDFDFLSDEAYFKEWMQLAVDYGNAIKKIEATKMEGLVNAVATSVLGYIYLNYTTDKPFIPQFEQNDKEYRKVLADLMQELLRAE